jgi:hypothetical protein
MSEIDHEENGPTSQTDYESEPIDKVRFRCRFEGTREKEPTVFVEWSPSSAAMSFVIDAHAHKTLSAVEPDGSYIVCVRREHESAVSRFRVRLKIAADATPIYD